MKKSASKRPKSQIGKIVIDPKVAFGKPTIAGTRIPVSLVVEFLSTGWEINKLLKEYPHLTREDIYAAVRYAVKLVRVDEEKLVELQKVRVR